VGNAVATIQAGERGGGVKKESSRKRETPPGKGATRFFISCEGVGGGIKKVERLVLMARDWKKGGGKRTL